MTGRGFGGGAPRRACPEQQPESDHDHGPGGMDAAAGAPAAARGKRLQPIKILLQPAKLEPDIPGILPALLPILCETGLHDPVECRRRGRLNVRDRRGLLGQDRGDHRGLTLAGERFPPCRHLVEHGPKSEEVGSRVSFLAFELLRGHVLERSQDRSLPRDGRPCRELRQRQ